MIQYEYKVIKSNVLADIQAEGLHGWIVVSYDYKLVLLMRPINRSRSNEE